LVNPAKLLTVDRKNIYMYM